MAFNQNYGSINAERVPTVGFSGGPRSDTSRQMQELVDGVSSKTIQLNTERNNLEQLQKSLGTPKDSPELRNRIQRVESSINETVKITAADLSKLHKYKQQADKPFKLQLERLTSAFQTTVESCSRAQKAALDKLRTTYLPSEAALMDSSPTGTGGASYLQPGQTTAEIRQVTSSLEFETGLLREREQRIASIEKNIIDVNQIMNELGALVYKQAEDINSIDNAIDRTHVDVELAQEELKKASEYTAQRRKKNCFLLSIAIIAVIVLVIIIVVSLH